MLLYYTPNLAENTAVLSKEESHHCVKVLRKKAGDTIHVTDGKGTLCEARIVRADREACEVIIINAERDYGKSKIHLHIAIAPTKNNARFEWFLEKATEIGINEISPIICKNSERETLNSERLEKLLVSAMKQSERAYLPRLNEAVAFSAGLREIISDGNTTNRFIANYDEGNKELKEALQKSESAIILIGPEGDFTTDELDEAMRQGFMSVNLGSSRLRTESAGIVACTVINHWV